MMNCEDFKALLPEYWDGKLDEPDRLILEAHLKRCDDCQNEADQLKQVWSGLGALATDAEPGDMLKTRFYDRLEAYRMGAGEKPFVVGGRKAGVMSKRPMWIPCDSACRIIRRGSRSESVVPRVEAKIGLFALVSAGLWTWMYSFPPYRRDTAVLITKPRRRSGRNRRKTRFLSARLRWQANRAQAESSTRQGCLDSKVAHHFRRL